MRKQQESSQTRDRKHQLVGFQQGLIQMCFLCKECYRITDGEMNQSNLDGEESHDEWLKEQPGEEKIKSRTDGCLQLLSHRRWSRLTLR